VRLPRGQERGDPRKLRSPRGRARGRNPWRRLEEGGATTNVAGG
jgi:hypothetical protein